MTKQFDALIFIGRYQPFHNGHKAVIEKALEQAKEVVIVVGSSFSSRSIRNPFTFEERKNMIKSVFASERVHIVPVADYPYDDVKWIGAVQSIVEQAVPKAKNIGLIGHSKDSTSYYLDIFPKWEGHVEVDNVAGLNATDIRKIILDPTFDFTNADDFVDSVPFDVQLAISRLWETEAMKNLRNEYAIIKKYKDAWKVAPFPPTFMTVDAVVTQSGHILLVKRGDMPGKGLWALPGGFLNQEETMEEGMLRELKEETKIKVPLPVLKGSVKASKTFDAPNRSTRGRTITQAFLIDLGVGELPKVKGSDDAVHAEWVSIVDVLKMRDQFFEDHFYIIDYFLKVD